MKNKGITLIALVISILVLIILSAVAINLSLGHNGILTKAEKAKENYIIAQNVEETEIDELYSQILIASDSTVTLTTEQLNEYINKKVNEMLVGQQQTITTEKGKYSFEKKEILFFVHFGIMFH